MLAKQLALRIYKSEICAVLELKPSYLPLGSIIQKCSQSASITASVAEPPLFWADTAPDGQCPGADSGSDLLGSAPAPYTKIFHFKLSKS